MLAVKDVTTLLLESIVTLSMKPDTDSEWLIMLLNVRTGVLLVVSVAPTFTLAVDAVMAPSEYMYVAVILFSPYTEDLPGYELVALSLRPNDDTLESTIVRVQ